MVSLRHAAAVALLLGTVAAAASLPETPAPAVDPSAPAGPVPGFRAFHYRSDLAAPERGFREVFLVESVDPGFAVRTADVEVREDGKVRSVSWEDADGWLGAGDRLSFVEEPTDQLHVLTAHVAGAQVMECRFGGGAGMGFTPDEWRAMGQPEQVRCLPPLDVDNVETGSAHGDGHHHDGTATEPHDH
jgi:hypothetical protein